MKLVHLHNQRVIISRLQPVSGTSNRLALSTVTGINGHLQSMSMDKVMQIQGVPGKTFKIFLEADSDIQDGDQLKDESGNLYTVKKGGITRWAHGAMDFKEVLIIQS